jgi:hypothetical protein
LRLIDPVAMLTSEVQGLLCRDSRDQHGSGLPVMGASADAPAGAAKEHQDEPDHQHNDAGSPEEADPEDQAEE